jgi:hypothetical protein
VRRSNKTASNGFPSEALSKLTVSVTLVPPAQLESKDPVLPQQRGHQSHCLMTKFVRKCHLVKTPVEGADMLS